MFVMLFFFISGQAVIAIRWCVLRCEDFKEGVLVLVMTCWLRMFSLMLNISDLRWTMDDVVGSKRILGCETLIVWRRKGGPLFTGQLTRAVDLSWNLSIDKWRTVFVPLFTPQCEQTKCQNTEYALL